MVKTLFADQGRTKLSKIDFFKIFAIFLPHEGPASSILKNSSNQIEDNNSADNNSDKNSNTSPLQTNKAYSKKYPNFPLTQKGKKGVAILQV